MNALDGIVVLVGVGAAVGGYRLGFVARALSWIGLAIGVTLATLLLPRIIQSFGGADELRLFLSAVGILVGSAALGQALGLLAGSRLRFAIPPGGAEVADRAAGSIVGALGVIVALWFLLPSMADVQGWPANQARTSAVAQAIDDALPDAPDSFQVLRQLIDQDQFPRVFDTLEPSPSLGSPPVSAELAPDVATRVTESAVQIRGEACGVIQEGSGFVAAPSVVLTNAHVVAGAESVGVLRSDGTELDATLVAFDPRRDIAALSVAGLDRPPLRIVDTEIDSTGGVFGYPEGGPLRIAPYRVGREVTATGFDLYERDRTRRQVYFVAASLRSGDSGAPLVNDRGEVVAMAFAIAPDNTAVGYALTDSELRDVLDGLSDSAAAEPADSGPCIN